MTEEEKELLQRKARAGAMAEIKRRWSERRDPGRIISSPAVRRTRSISSI